MRSEWPNSESEDESEPLIQGATKATGHSATDSRRHCLQPALSLLGGLLVGCCFSLFVGGLHRPLQKGSGPLRTSAIAEPGSMHGRSALGAHNASGSRERAHLVGQASTVIRKRPEPQGNTATPTNRSHHADRSELFYGDIEDDSELSRAIALVSLRCGC